MLPPALLPPYTDVPSCSRSPDTPWPLPSVFLCFSLSLSPSLVLYCMPRDPTRSLKANFRAKLIHRYVSHAEHPPEENYEFGSLVLSSMLNSRFEFHRRYYENGERSRKRFSRDGSFMIVNVGNAGDSGATYLRLRNETAFTIGDKRVRSPEARRRVSEFLRI